MFSKPINSALFTTTILPKFFVFIGFLAFSNLAFALSDEALFQHARESYNAKNLRALTDDASELKAQQYVLAPYADYWLMLLKLDQARDEEVQNYIAQYTDTPFADRVRGEWLKKLAKQKIGFLF
jgi:hypothetical protein